MSTKRAFGVAGVRMLRLLGVVAAVVVLGYVLVPKEKWTWYDWYVAEHPERAWVNAPSR